MAYTATVTADTTMPERIGRRFGMLTGSVDITAYHQTLAEITDITRHFKDTTLGVTVTPCGVTDNGYLLAWNSTSKAFKAYKGDYSASVDGPMVEVGNDVDVGAVKFIAVGLWG